MMHRRRLLATLSGGAAAALAGCTGGGSDGGDEAGDRTTASDATVRVRSTEEYGDVLVDAEGMSLYLFEQDDGGESTCYDDCAQNWPPLTVDDDPTAGPDVTASLATTEREDGARQVTAGDWPLYYFDGDAAPGDAEGQGLSDVWWLVAPDGTAVTSASPATTTDDGGMY